MNLIIPTFQTRGIRRTDNTIWKEMHSILQQFFEKHLHYFEKNAGLDVI